MIIQPQKNFPIVRQIGNHLDTGTYFVRAVIRDADGTILDTIDLVDKTGQRFQKQWHSVADGSGQGRYISIVTSVYTNSGYTTKSENYADEENTYLVFDRVSSTLRGGGGGGVDARTVRRIVEDVVGKIPVPEKVDLGTIPKPEKVELRWEEVLQGLKEIKIALDNVPTEIVSLSPVVSRLNDIAQMIETKEVTPETDLSPVLDVLGDTKEENRMDNNEMKDFLKGVEDTLGNKIVEAVKDTIGKTNFTTSVTTQATQDKSPNQEPLRKEEVKKQFNLKNLIR